jgi:TRAP-type mannitol/chloroaromatic compound transport system substrate-binding protein
MKRDYPNIKVKTFSKAIMDAMKKANQELRTELSAKSSRLKEVLDHQDTYLKKVREWTRMSDYLYLHDNLK